MYLKILSLSFCNTLLFGCNTSGVCMSRWYTAFEMAFELSVLFETMLNGWYLLVCANSSPETCLKRRHEEPVILFNSRNISDLNWFIPFSIFHVAHFKISWPKGSHSLWWTVFWFFNGVEIMVECIHIHIRTQTMRAQWWVIRSDLSQATVT